MDRRCTRPPAQFARLTWLLLLAGCGATSTQSPVAANTGTTSSAMAALAPRGPQLGYAWDANQKNLYPLLGIAGAAHYGAALLTQGAGYMAGAVSGSGAGTQWALVLDGAGTLDEMTLPSVTPRIVTTRVPLDASIVFAPGGGYAVLLSLSTNYALLVSGLPAQPLVAELAVPPGSALAGAAVSDRGTVLAGWTSSSGVQVGILSATGVSVLAHLSAWGGGAFAPGVAAAGQEQAVVADAATGQVARLSLVGSPAAAVSPLNSGGKLQTPVAVAISGDGLWAFAADSAQQQVVRLDLSGSTAPLSIPCTCQPARLTALPGNTLFEVSVDQATQPVWLLDGHALTPRTFFVPALAAPAASTVPASATSQAQSKVPSTTARMAR